MQLSPLQSRLAASLVASCLLLALYLFLFPPQFALAAELDLSLGAEHHHRQVQEIVVEDYPHGGGASTGPAVVAAAVDGRTAPEMYEAEFDGFDRGIIGHAPSTGVTALVNNVPVSMDVEAGSTRFFVFEARTIFQPAPEDVDGHTGDTTRKEAGGSVGAGVGVGDDGEGSAESRPELLRRRPQPGGTREIFISVNTCMQPSPLDSTSASGGASRQLRLYVSTSPENTFPGPGQSQGDTQTMTVFDEGAVMFSTVVSSQQDVHIGVSTPNLTDAGFSGVWNFEIAASRDAFYHRYETDATASGTADLHCVGTDRGSALLVTRPLTETMDADEVERMMADGAPQFVMFAHNRKYGAAVDGLRHSFCGLRNNAQITTTTDSASANMVSTSITKRGAGGLPKQQFHVRGLNSTSDYVGILARSVGSGPGSVGGGGIVLRQANFSTSAGEC